MHFKNIFQMQPQASTAGSGVQIVSGM